MSTHRACSVFLCRSSTRGQPVSVSYHSFPKDAQRCRLWVKACRNAPIEQTFRTEGAEYMYRHHKVCSRHFLPSDFRNPNLTSQGLIPGAVPSRRLRNRLSELKKARAVVEPSEKFEDSDVSPEAVEGQPCEVNPLLLASPPTENCVGDLPGSAAKEHSKENSLVSNVGVADVEGRPADRGSLGNLEDVEITEVSVDRFLELQKNVEILKRNLEMSHKILIDTQRDNAELKRRLSRVPSTIESHEARYRCTEDKLNELRRQNMKFRIEKKKLSEDKTSPITAYAFDERDRGFERKYSETDRIFSVCLYMCSKLVYRAMEKHFLLPSIDEVDEWLRDVDFADECKRKIPEAEMFQDNEADFNVNNELIKLEYVDVPEAQLHDCVQNGR